MKTHPRALSSTPPTHPLHLSPIKIIFLPLYISLFLFRAWNRQRESQRPILTPLVFTFFALTIPKVVPLSRPLTHSLSLHQHLLWNVHNATHNHPLPAKRINKSSSLLLELFVNWKSIKEWRKIAWNKICLQRWMPPIFLKTLLFYQSLRSISGIFFCRNVQV